MEQWTKKKRTKMRVEEISRKEKKKGDQHKDRCTVSRRKGMLAISSRPR